MQPNTTSRDNSSRSGHEDRSAQHLQRFFLERLLRMVAIRNERGPLLEAGDPDLRLLDKAVYSTFCDCLDLGAGERARAILHHQPAGVEDLETPNVDSN
ncbi:MAG: hypothetical protein ACM3US_16125 [Sphingomonadaceae bacterium]